MNKVVLFGRYFSHLLLFLFLGFATNAFSQVPPPPVILDIGPSGCQASQELCGDGIDQDCNGQDLACPGPDGDRDGFSLGADCDDTNRLIYPGISTACSAGCGSGTRICQTNGSYSACSCTPLCQGSRCFYISALTGSDNNPGTFAAPWKTVAKVISYYGPGPSGWVQLQAGDVVYFLSGMYRERHEYNGQGKLAYFRGINGSTNAPIQLKAYPGAHPVLWPANRHNSLELYQSSNVIIDGFEVMGAYGTGITLSEVSNIEVRNTWIHDIDGVDNDNVAGLYLVSAQNIELHHNLIHDNYDHTNADTGGQKTQNSRNVVLFGGGNIRIHHSIIFQTPPINAAKTGGCINYKHSATVAGSVFEVDHNTMWNCALYSVGSGTFNTKVHHNLILNSDAIAIEDFGGATHNVDNLIEFNTISGGAALSYEPTSDWGPIGLLTFRKNIVVDSGSYNFEHGIVTIHPYGSDALYDQTVTAGNLSFSQNCYYNSSTSPQWSLFAGNGGAYGVRGALHSFSSWQDLGLDSNSLVLNPALNNNHSPQTAACQSMGWLAN